MAKIINLKSSEGLGNATSSDVKKGVVFTSENGVALVGAGIKETEYLLQTESGDTTRAILSTDEEVILTAKAEDILVGKTAVTEDGIVEGILIPVEPAVEGVASYLTFVDTNASADAVDAAFGKNNEENINGVGLALAMYARFKGETESFDNLEQCNSLFDVDTNYEARAEIRNSESIGGLLYSLDYFYSTFNVLKASLLCGSSSGIHESNIATATINITQEMIDGKVQCFVDIEAKSGNHSYCYAYAQFNGVDIMRLGQNKTYPLTRTVIDLPSYNITEAGDYVLTCKTIDQNTVSDSYLCQVKCDFCAF